MTEKSNPAAMDDMRDPEVASAMRAEEYDAAPQALAAPPAVGGEDRRTEALRVISTLAICEEGETAEERERIVDACREVAANALVAQPASPLRGRDSE